MVTAELAAALPTLVVVLVLSVWGIAYASAQLRCIDAAREAARAGARGEDLTTVVEIAQAVAPDGATVDITEENGMVMIEVSVTVGAPPPLGSAVAPTARGRAVALSERP